MLRECSRTQALLSVGIRSLSLEARFEVADHLDLCSTCAASFDAFTDDKPCPKEAVPHGDSHVETATCSAAGGAGFQARLVRDVLDDVERHRRRRRGTVVLHDATLSDAPSSSARFEAFDILEGQLAPGQCLQGAVFQFTIRRLIGLGAFTETYVADYPIDAPGVSTRVGTAALKIPRLAHEMSPDAARDRLRLLSALIPGSAHSLGDLAGLPNVARMVDSGHYVHRLHDRSAESSFIAYEFVEGGRDLATYLRARYSFTGQFVGVPSAGVFAEWARRLTAGVLDMHTRFVIHGDITPRNIVVTPDGRIVFVDVGQSLFREVMHGTNDFSGFFYRAPEGITTPSSDLFSLGGVLYFVVTGKEPIGFVTHVDIETLKQQVSLKIKQANPRLFHEDAGVADIVAMCLRTHGRVEHANQLMAEIDTFWPETTPSSVSLELEALAAPARELDSVGNVLYRSVASAHLRSCRRVLSDLSNGAFDVSGPSSEIRRAAYALLTSLRAGDEFLSVALPAFWYPENIGINGRFLSMCRNAAARGAFVRRVFLLDDDLSDRHLQAIVAAQLSAVDDLDQEYRPNLAVRYMRMSADRRRRVVADGKLFGLLVKDGSEIAVFPVYNASGTLVTMRIRSGARHVDGLRELFEMFWGDACPLADLKLPTSSLNIDLVASSIDTTCARSTA